MRTTYITRTLLKRKTQRADRERLRDRNVVTCFKCHLVAEFAVWQTRARSALGLLARSRTASQARVLSNGFRDGADVPPDRSSVTITCAPRGTRTASAVVPPSNVPAGRTSGSATHAS
jgi:hypothetical protein